MVNLIKMSMSDYHKCKDFLSHHPNDRSNVYCFHRGVPGWVFEKYGRKDVDTDRWVMTVEVVPDGEEK